MKRMMLIKLVIGCILLTSGCGEETTSEKKEYHKTEPTEAILVEKTLTEETIIGW